MIDAAVALPKHRRHSRFDGLPHPGQVDVDLILELLFGQSPTSVPCRSVCRRSPPRCRGGPARRDPCRHRLLDPGVPDVDLAGEDAAAATLDQIDGRERDRRSRAIG